MVNGAPRLMAEVIAIASGSVVPNLQRDAEKLDDPRVRG
jgi:hypothetical protein